MASEQVIKDAIERKRGSLSYGSWTIGITNDPKRRREEHNAEGKNTSAWSHWEADSESIARNVEQYFLNKGMKGGAGGGSSPTPRWVYIF